MISIRANPDGVTGEVLINGLVAFTFTAAAGVVIPAGAVTPTKLSGFNTLGNYANDAAAAVGGVAVGGMYRNGSVVQVRVV